MSRAFDVVIVGGGSAGSVLGNRLSADAGTRVLVLEAGRPDYRWDAFIQMPAALTFPIGSRYYDWRYASEPEPFMHGRRVVHARGKDPGRVEQHQRDDLPARQPARLRAVGGRPRHGDVGLRALPAVLPADGDVPRRAPDDPFHGHAGPLVLERGPATNPLFGAFFEAVRQAGYSLTDDVNGYRQEGFAPFDRNVRDGRRLSASRAYLHPVMDRPNLAVETRAFVTRVVFRDGRAVGVEYVAVAAASGSVVRAGEVDPLPAARSTRRSCWSSAGWGTRTRLGALRITVAAHAPGVGQNLQDHLEVYLQHASRLPVSVQPSLQKWRRPWIGFQWLVLRRGPGATNHFEGGGFARSNDDVAYPNLMFHFLPVAIRYDGSAPAGGHGYQVHIGPMYSDARGSVHVTSRDPRVHPALRFNYLSTAQDRREWVEAIAVARTILGQQAFAPFDAGEISPGPERGDRRAGARLGRARRRDGAPSVVHGPDGRRRDVRRGPDDDEGARRRGPPRRGRERHAVRDEREHLRPGDDARGEGGRPHTR